jgi:hypothetical protein
VTGMGQDCKEGTLGGFHLAKDKKKNKGLIYELVCGTKRKKSTLLFFF